MAALHSALRSLAPVSYSDVPQDGLDQYLVDLYADVQTVVESIPIAEPDASATRQRAMTTSSLASNASEMSTSSVRSEPPLSQYQALQKEWGKPLKINKNENKLGISVYKLGGKDGRGAWFARRSVHEGLGFARFKKAFETEFPTSLAVQGAPGEGNIRGIGAETKIEDIEVPHRGKIQVYRLSAQFPGPTTPRDFVTFLATSSRAMKHEDENGKVPDLVPRHYMIISKPCNHPETQPRDGFIRGQYESVEFIREIPRKLKASQSSTDLTQTSHKHEQNLEHDLLVRNVEKHLSPPHEEGDSQDIRKSRESSPSGRRRSKTVNFTSSTSKSHDDHDPEDNPVEWIMVTRSDPGGSVPRFLVDRGTPGSICADAVKFLDWACGLQQGDNTETPVQPPKPFRRESFTSWQEDENKTGAQKLKEAEPPRGSGKIAHAQTSPPELQDPPRTTSPGIVSSVSNLISAYTPQAVLNQLPHGTPTQDKEVYDSGRIDVSSPGLEDDAASTISSTSFASADSYLDDHESKSTNTLNDVSTASTQQAPTQHEKELTKLNERRATMESKFAATRSKLEAQSTNATEKEQAEIKKAEERHQKDLKKHEERYAKELAKIDARKAKEAKKAEDRKKKAADKDEKTKLTRERDEATAKIALLEKERDVWMKQVGELQKENTSLMQKIGKLEGSSETLSAVGSKGRVATFNDEGNRSRSSSLLSRKKERVGTGLGSEMSAQSGIKSEASSQAS